MDFKTEFGKALKSVGDQASLSEILTNISDEVFKILESNDLLTKDNAKLSEDNQNLRDTNHRLFLKIGSVIIPEPAEPEPAKKKMELSDLFNEKGELK